MVAFSVMGYQALVELNGGTSLGEIIDKNGDKVAMGAARAYYFSSAAQRLLLYQIVYEAKNFVDSILYNDGVIFLVHHVVVGTLSVS
jgi:hypothetical protein